MPISELDGDMNGCIDLLISGLPRNYCGCAMLLARCFQAYVKRRVMKTVIRGTGNSNANRASVPDAKPALTVILQFQH